MLLLKGKSVITDESALTGEATPQAKLPIDSQSIERYKPIVHKHQTLFAGTSVMECDDSALALVVKTASYTTKGELLRDILARRSHKVQLYVELPVAVAFLMAFGLACFVFVLFNSSDQPIVAWALGMTAFSNAFPPLLPISLLVPIGISFERLARAKIACANSDSILIAGRVNRAFFDKTGTLTEQGLAFVSSRCARSRNRGLTDANDLRLAMSVCHTLAYTESGQVVGNPVDRAMFATSKAKILNSHGEIELSDKSTVQVLRRFDFDHYRMTQGVVVKCAGGVLKAIVKGSAEKISQMCEVPASVNKDIQSSSRTGMFLIAVASRNIDSIDDAIYMDRDALEMSLTFVGVLSFANRLRKSTPRVIESLYTAGVDSVLLTGDNVLTGVHVAKESNIIPANSTVVVAELSARREGAIDWTNDESGKIMSEGEVYDLVKSTKAWLALSGDAWSRISTANPNIALRLAPSIRVVGRCSPQDKVSVIEAFISLGYTTSMCGDGGNDCGALRAAHIGIALSDSDASLVAPFTSLDKDIESVVAVLREGRSAVASTLATYKYIIMYGNISSYCQLITYKFLTSFSDWMWVFTDGVWTVTFSVTLPLAKPAPGILSKFRPSSSLLGWDTVLSLAGAILLNYIFMAVALSTLLNEDWFACRKWDASIQAGNVLLASDNYETQVTFLMVGYQCIFAAMIFNFGYEFREAWWKNYAFVLPAVGFLLMHLYITLIPGRLSCFWRTNCVNEYVVRGVLTSEPLPLNNSYNTTARGSTRVEIVVCLAHCWSLVFDSLFGSGCVYQSQRRQYATDHATQVPRQTTLCCLKQRRGPGLLRVFCRQWVAPAPQNAATSITTTTRNSS